MLVYVINRKGIPLMPCSSARARLLLKEGKASVLQRTPFTIRLIHGSSGYVQPITLGVDSGFMNVGLSAVSAGKELYAANVKLRSDIVRLNSKRRMYRQSRRGRKTWYRQPRFDNRKKPGGWLTPSIQHKLESHIKLINQIKAILPIVKTVVEVAAFDIQKIKNPDIGGAGYQNGDQRGFWNVRGYVLYRDGYRCQAPGCNHKDPYLNVHHIESRQTGGDRPGNLITLCKSCHHMHHNGRLSLKVRAPTGYKAETFMTIVRWRLVSQTGSESTFGYITKSRRIDLGLKKSHVNDAFVIAGGTFQNRTEFFTVHQVRKCNRKLFKGGRSHIKNTASREVFGFRQWDKVRLAGKELFIKGRRLSGFFSLSEITGKQVCEASYKKLKLLERASTLLIERSR